VPTATESQGLHTTHTFNVVLLTTGDSTYANHDAYVSAMAGGDDTTHS
jgi:hypothetical protein